MFKLIMGGMAVSVIFGTGAGFIVHALASGHPYELIMAIAAAFVFSVGSGSIYFICNMGNFLNAMDAQLNKKS